MVPNEQRVHRVDDAPIIEIFSNGVRKEIGLWLEVTDSAVIPNEVLKLAFVRATILKKGSEKQTPTMLELSVSSSSIFRHFYHFAIATSERVFVERIAPMDAVIRELQCFSELLEEKPLLGIERQVGLIGELIALERLIERKGLDALDAWSGPLKEPHDFRLGRSEYEVKTTICPQRIHTISSFDQLVPSTGCKLYLLSILLGPAATDDSFSLAEKVQNLSAKFQSVPARLQQFTSALERSGFRDADLVHYSRRFTLRRPLATVRVNADFPAITRQLIQETLGIEVAPRIEAVHYDVNVEGMEIEDGKPGFPPAFQG